LNKFLLYVLHFVLNKYCDLRQAPKSSVVEKYNKMYIAFRPTCISTAVIGSSPYCQLIMMSNVQPVQVKSKQYAISVGRVSR